MPKYDPLSHRLAPFLLGSKRKGHERPALIDLFECGTLQAVEGDKPVPKPWNVAWQLADRRMGWPKRATKRHIEENLQGVEVHYFRSNRTSGFAFLMIDYDAKNGEPDALSAAEAVEQAYLPGAYNEPSTGGKGRHQYVLVRIGRWKSRRKVNRWLREVASSLRGLVSAWGYKAQVDRICGDFSEFDYDAVTGIRTPARMGTFAKMPRLPNGHADMDALEAAPVFLPAALDRIIDDYKRLRATKTGRNVSKGQTIRHNDPRRGRDDGDVLFRGMNWYDPRSRATHAVMHLARELGRLPSVPEARVYYEYHNLHTVPQGGDSPSHLRRRERRLATAIDFVSQTFDEALTRGRGYHPERLLPLIRAFVRPEDMTQEGLCYKKKVTEEDLAITLHGIEKPSWTVNKKPKYQWTCPNSAIQGTFASLRAAGRTNRGCNRNKAISCKTILVRAGLAEVIDDSYVVGTRGKKTGDEAWDRVGKEGRGKRVVIGPKHPMRREWDKFRKEVEDRHPPVVPHRKGAKGEPESSTPATGIHNSYCHSPPLSAAAWTRSGNRVARLAPQPITQVLNSGGLLSSLNDMFERGEPLPFKERAYAKYVAHGHLAAASHHENVLWIVIYTLSNDVGFLTPDYEQITQRTGLTEQALRETGTSLVKKKLVAVEGEGFRLLEPPDNWDFYNRLQRAQQLGFLDDEE